MSLPLHPEGGVVELDEHFLVEPNEAEVLRLLADGLTDEQIADAVSLSLSGVRSRLAGFYDRSGIHGRKAVSWAGRHKECCCGRRLDAAW